MASSLPSSPGPVRRRYLFSGYIQGVGFRYALCTLARQLALKGWVRNLEDGRVEAQAEGSPQALDQLLRALCATKRFSLSGVRVMELPAQLAEPTFRILY